MTPTHNVKAFALDRFATFGVNSYNIQMKKQHHYQAGIRWTGNRGEGTSNYKAYGRDHVISIPGKPDIEGSSDPAFRGDAGRYNPEELLLAAISACHMLWYLHLCAEAGVVVLNYMDKANALMQEDETGMGRFTEATLSPFVTVADQHMTGKAMTLHHEAHRFCFIANSVNFPVKYMPDIRVA